jgi:hypothetical protein
MGTVQNPNGERDKAAVPLQESAQISVQWVTVATIELWESGKTRR